MYRLFQYLVVLGGIGLLGVLFWQGFTAGGTPDPTVANIGFGAAVVDTAVLVFREGLETILVLAVIMAGFTGVRNQLKQPVAAGASLGLLASAVTWFVAVGILADLSKNFSALNIQAATGMIAVVVLCVVMNWFFHQFYWTDWLSMFGRYKRELIAADGTGTQSMNSSQAHTFSSRLLWGMVSLGFFSVYREGFEVVLFLQSLRLQVGSLIVMQGVGLGLFFTSIVGIITFWAHRRLPHRRMLIITGVMLFIVLLVMVGEEAQEMQLAGWISTTTLDWPIPAWLGVWFSLFPTVETIAAQVLATVVVLGSYFGRELLLSSRRKHNA